VVTNTKPFDYIVILLGVVGVLFNIYGQTLAYPQPYYVAGSFLLLVVAVYFHLLFFTGLEAILLSGHFALMLDLNYRIQFALPILLCLQLVVYYLYVGRLKSMSVWFGLTGIAFLSIGFSYHRQWVFLVGSIFITLYSFRKVRETAGLSIIWGILNAFFTIFVAIKLYLQYFEEIF
jgi:hypothetical protein